MKNIKTFIIIVFSILNFSACNTPEPIDQALACKRTKL